jgi:predicted unusual protein kinase regulating ubiquinone biosynthesis (AarF/ABC1/UbiB family)
LHLSEFVKVNQDKKLSNLLGQALWDFYMYQIHQLKQFHADPHPGNFLISKENKLIAIDFGCIKAIPNEFYTPFFELAKKENIDNPVVFKQKLLELEILFPQDKAEDVTYFTALFHELLSLFTRPFNQETFDFSDESFFEEITQLGQKYANNNEYKKLSGARGSRHFIYMNRTFFGLYNLMFDLKSENVVINNYKNFINQSAE